MAAARSDWRGAVNVQVQGFDVPIALAFYKRVARPKPQSFRTLDPVHKQPCRKPFVDVDGNEVATADTLKGVEGPGGFVALGDKSLELIERATRSEACDIAQFVDSDTVPLELALESYHVMPDEKVAGSASSYNTFWNMLHGTDRCAAVDGWCARSGARPSILLLRATNDGLIAYVMPYGYEVRRAPATVDLQVNEKAATLAASVIESYDNGPFDFSAFEDTYTQRRQAAIDLALSGEEPPADLAPKAVPSGAPDLLAALEASVSAAAEKPTAKKPAVKRPSKKAVKAAKEA